MGKELILAVLVMLMFLSSVIAVSAFEVEGTCLNATHIQKIAKITICEGDVCTNYNFTQTPIKCQWNCTNNACMGTGESMNYMTMIPPLVLGVALMFVSPMIKDIAFKDIKWFLFFLGVYFIIITFTTTYKTAVVAGAETGVKGMLSTSIMILEWAMYLMLFLFSLWFLVKVLLHLRDSINRKKGEKWEGRFDEEE